MIEYKTGLSDIDWESLTALYHETNLVVGLGKKKDLNKIREAFENSYKIVTAWESSKLVGAGRLISDGVCYGMIHDVGVLPSYQRAGIGKKIMSMLLEGNDHLYIGLTSTFGNEDFYYKLGFKKHKTALAKYPNESRYLEN